MREHINIRRYDGFVRVNVTRKAEHSVHWSVRVIGPTEESVATAIKECRSRLDMLGSALSQCETGGEA